MKNIAVLFSAFLLFFTCTLFAQTDSTTSVNTENNCVLPFTKYYDSECFFQDQDYQEFMDVRFVHSQKDYFVAGRSKDDNYLEVPTFSRIRGYGSNRGEVVWSKKFEGIQVMSPVTGNMEHRDFSFHRFTMSSSGYFYIVGVAEELQNGASYDESNQTLFIAKMDVLGNVLWQEKILASGTPYGGGGGATMISRVSNPRINVETVSGVTYGYIDYWFHTNGGDIFPVTLKFQDMGTGLSILADKSVFHYLASAGYGIGTTILNQSDPITTSSSRVYAGSILPISFLNLSGKGIIYTTNSNTLSVVANAAKLVSLNASNSESIAITGMCSWGSDYYFCGFIYNTTSGYDNPKCPIIIKTNSSYAVSWAYSLNSSDNSIPTGSKGWGLIPDANGNIYLAVSKDEQNYLVLFKYDGSVLSSRYYPENITERYNPWRTFTYSSAGCVMSGRPFIYFGQHINKVASNSNTDAFLGMDIVSNTDPLVYCDNKTKSVSLTSISIKISPLTSSQQNVYDCIYAGGTLCSYVTIPDWDALNVVENRYSTRVCISSNNARTPLAFESNDYIQLFPNPAHDLLRIKLPINHNVSLIRIMSTTGTIVQETRVEDGAMELELNISSLPQGVFYLVVENQGKLEYLRFAKD